MNTQQLESFIQVAEHLNFARAAEVLNMTQSAVSRQIHALEEELNTKLFYRTTRTVALTPDGIIFLEHAEQILAQLKLAAAKIQHHSNTRAQILTIGCKSEAALDALRGTLTACRERIEVFHPFLKIVSHRSLLNLFFQGEIEVIFGFQDNLPVKSDVEFVELGRAPLCCVVPCAHPYARRETVTEEDLFSENFIICKSYLIPLQAAEVQNRITQHISPEKIYISESPQAILTLIRAGYGCSVLPQAAPRDPSLAYVPLKEVRPLSYGIIYNKTSSNPVLRQFVRIAAEQAGR